MSLLSKLYSSPIVNELTGSVPLALGSIGNLFSPRTQTLPNGAGSFSSPVPAQAPAPVASMSSGTTDRLFATGPAAVAPQEPAYTQDHLKAVADAAYNVINGGDIPAYLGETYGNPNPSIGEAKNTTRNLNNARNDIATGVTDPLGWMSQKDVAYSPEEINAIRKAQAGIYDPAIHDAMNRLDQATSKKSASDSLTAGQMQSALTQIASQFDNEPAVRQYQTIAQTVNAVKGLGDTPVDDIRRVYAVAKVFDPNSAVREGEYKTVQDYATSLLQRAGLKANRVFNNDGFLTQQAKDFINSTLDNELKTSNKTYQNIYQGYLGKIDAIKQGQATASLVDYSKGFNETGASKPETIDYQGHTYEIQPDGSARLMTFKSVGGDTKNLATVVNPKGTNRPQRNNNPLNIKASQFTSSFPGVAGVDPVPARDGGQFLAFESPQAGYDGAKRLLTSGSYAPLTVDAALRRWSGGGYGGEIAGPIASKRIIDLSPTELTRLMQTMAKREGYYA